MKRTTSKNTRNRKPVQRYYTVRRPIQKSISKVYQKKQTFHRRSA